KSLFSAGTSWPGVWLREDITSLDILSKRPEVDPERLGCVGLSLGGLRTVYMGGLDPRIKCAVCAGMMMTWRDLVLNKSVNHTWMIYIPRMAHDLDYPEILGLRAPLPTLVLNNREDPLFTLPEMERADRMLTDVFARAGAPDRYETRFYPGGHKFDLAMQADAFDWFDRWLKDA
ncbi:MAG: acetylxylan esterase, partial [Caldilineaceae bacterium]|nr:acetylxylan esterase [Caldilineaceae bacterium]